MTARAASANWRGTSLSFVLPAHDEASNIESAVERCVAVGEALQLDFEVWVVDDGSRDGTGERVMARAAADPRVRLLRHDVNLGYGAAVRSGLRAAAKDWVFFTDADLQFDVAELVRLLDRTSGADVVVGYRSPRRDPWPRRVLGWSWTQLTSRWLGLGVRDVNCAFKLIRRNVVDAVELRSSGAFVNAELLAGARAAGFVMREVPVSHHRRARGVPSGAHPAVMARAVRELVALGPRLRDRGVSPSR